MRSPQRQQNQTQETVLRNGGIETPSPRPRIQAHFHSTVSEQKLRRLNILILVFRFATLCFSLAAAIFMFSTTRARGSKSPSWTDFEALRFVGIANAIVALYSLFEVGASVWEITGGTTFLPEVLQVWFDFAHDQVFAYMLLSADSAGTELARSLKGKDTCTESNAFCIQSDISIALGFAGFLFLGLSALLSGFRVASYIINGSRFHL
ncbi:OLC1v1027666C1 [Oldenlandia corymbosa var. corymbosa]|uniref:CASP-like protein n=1 Tax=Oldenlandia corymbosa var. corymbosa TaxID=529605 RepID=A0AAV1CAL5_OLDCO|nr:OLC1v1027666C1 [Oldenlandia corymbosa var. corymbosa]